MRLSAEDQMERRRESFADSLDNLLSVLTPQQELERAQMLQKRKPAEEKLESLQEAATFAVRAWDAAGENRPEWGDMEDAIEMLRRLT